LGVTINYNELHLGQPYGSAEQRVIQ